MFPLSIFIPTFLLTYKPILPSETHADAPAVLLNNATFTPPNILEHQLDRKNQSY